MVITQGIIIIFSWVYKLEKLDMIDVLIRSIFCKDPSSLAKPKCKSSFHPNKWVLLEFLKSDIGVLERERERENSDDHLLQASVSIMIKKRFYSDKEIYRSNRLLLAFSRLTLIHCNVITSFRILKIQTNKKQPVNFNALKIPKKSQIFLHFQLWVRVLKI